MAQATLPSSTARESWLDRPIAPSWQRIAALAVHWELFAFGTLILIGFILRIWDVGGRAMHHDESLHAYYAWQFFVGRGYSYNPLMHGPLQFEVVPVFYLLFGVGEFAARFFAVLLGSVLIGLPYFLRHHLTKPGALLASLMLAVSPSLVYFSRFIRDDIYLACFALVLFICVIRYVETHRVRFLYLGSATMALAMASMEAAYLLFFIFGTFIIFEAVRELLAGRQGPVTAAFKVTSLDSWLTAVSIFVVLTVLFYSTFFTNPYGIWDTRYGFQALTSPNRQDILGGLTYWQAQHALQRGGQPWFYYLLVLPLYEQLAVVFGLAGVLYALVRRSLVRTFLVWWAAGSFLLYSWAGEKMPWLSMHITLPLILLAALFLGDIVSYRRGWPLLATGSAFAALFALEVHSTFALNYRDGANPTEMLIYVQTSQDVPNVVNEISQLSHRSFGGTSMPIGLDSNDVGGWPFIWYLRDYPNVTETATFSGPTCANQYCPVLLMLGPEFDQYGAHLAKRYIAQKYRWNWWFPEDYKQWFPDHVGTIPLALAGKGKLSAAPVGTQADWQHLWNWIVYREPFADRAARWLYVLVRRDLVPGAKYYSSAPAGGSTATTLPAATSSLPALPAILRTSIGGSPNLSGPRGVASDSHGDLYVADPPGHRVVEFSAGGALLRSWGSAGAGSGQFASLDSPQGIAVAPNGSVYVADTWNQRIQVFSPSGRFLRQWGGGAIGVARGQFYGPRSLAVARDGRVYVADTGNERIQVFSASGKYLSDWGSRGNGRGQFTEPSSVAVGPSGTVYVSDFWNQRVEAFTASGSFLRSWSVTDWTPHSYDEPYLAISALDGTIYASEPQQQRVLAWAPGGRVIGTFGSSHLALPVGLAVRPDGEVAVGDATSAKIAVFSLHPAGRGLHKR